MTGLSTKIRIPLIQKHRYDGTIAPEFFATISIGTPPQRLLLDVDTGSADLWVWSKELIAPIQYFGRRRGHKIFDAAQSKTWTALSDAIFHVAYGDGSELEGSCGTDVITLGESSIKAQSQTVLLPQHLSSKLRFALGDGVLGLACAGIMTSVKPQPVPSLLGNLRQAENSSFAIVSLALGGYEGSEAFMTLGGIDTNFSKELKWAPIIGDRGLWQVQASHLSVSRKKITREGNLAVIDSGTSLLLIHEDLCENFYRHVPGAHYDEDNDGWVMPRDIRDEQLPTLRVSVGLHEVHIHKKHLKFADVGDTFVFGSIQARPNDQSYDLYGCVFLKCVYAVFDMENNRFGFSPLE